MKNFKFNQLVGGGGTYPLNKRFSGFTLAEVLITLGVIGVVSALTMPTLVANHQKQSTLVQLKKAYQIFSEAVERALEDNGGFIIVTEEMAQAHTVEGNVAPFTSQYIDPYLKGVQPYKGKNLPILSASKQGTFIIPYYKSDKNGPMCISNGMCYWVHMHSAGPNYTTLFVDLNGPKGPNRAGRDVFSLLHFQKDNPSNMRIYKGVGLATTHSGISPNSDRAILKASCNKEGKSDGSSDAWNGRSCFQLIVKDDWKIADDYPW